MDAAAGKADGSSEAPVGQPVPTGNRQKVSQSCDTFVRVRPLPLFSPMLYHQRTKSRCSFNFAAMALLSPSRLPCAL